MADSATSTQIYVTYWLFRLEHGYRTLDRQARQEAQREFVQTLERRDKSVTLRGVYSLVGLRHNADLMVWVLGPDLDAIQQLAIALRHTALGAHLTPVETYIGATAAARYDPEHQPAFLSGVTPKKFLSLYPFIKTTDWYLLPFEQRRDLMAEHGRVGRKYAVPRSKLLAESESNRDSGNGATATAVQTHAATTTEEEGGGVLSSTVDSFGLGDYEFILANESDDPAELVRMMHSLRATEVRRYTAQDTPIYLCRYREPAEALADL